MRVFGASAIVWLASLAMGNTHAQGFTFAGFQRDMDLAALLERYPQSSHDVTPGAGVRRRTSQDDLKTWMREFFHAPGSNGTYVLRLTPNESQEHLYYVQAEVRQGVTERLWLLLEMPADPGKPGQSIEARYPACDAVLGPLTAKYGKPEALPPRWEEGVQSFNYVWTSAPETMKLECWRYAGRESMFAIGVTLERMGAR